MNEPISVPRTAIHTHTGRILANALSLFASTVVTSGFGFVFWWAAAHLWSKSALGASGAAVSALQLLGTAGMLGLGTLLVGELSKRPKDGPSLVTTALVVSGCAGLMFAGAYITGIALASLTHHELPSSPIGLAAFVGAVGVSAALLVYDDATIGLGHARWQLWRNVAFSVSKLALLPVFAVIGVDGTSGVVESWLAGALISVLALVLLFRGQFRRSFGRLRRSLIRSHGISAIIHHFLNLSSSAPRLLLPVLVAGFLSTSINARFYAALLLIGFPQIIPTHLSTALFAVASGDRAALRSALARTIQILLGVSLVSSVGFLLLGRQLLSLFGHGYSAAAPVLVILGFAIFQSGVKSVYISVCRVNGDLARCAQLCSFGSLFEVVAPAVVLALGGGLNATAFAWAAVMTLESLVVWPIVQVARTGRPSLAVRLTRWCAPRTVAISSGVPLGSVDG